MPGVSGVTVVTMLVCFVYFAREAAGASGGRHAPRRLSSEGERLRHNSGISCREITDPYLNGRLLNIELLKLRSSRLRHAAVVKQGMTLPKNAPIDIKVLTKDLRGGSRAALARAITLIQSRRGDHQAAARDMVQALLPDTGDRKSVV